MAVDRLREIAGREKLTDAAAAERFGVSESTWRRWRQLRDEGEEIPEPRGANRRALQSAMADEGVPTTRETPAPYGAEPGSDLERAWLDQLRRISESDESEAQKMLSIDSLASLIGRIAWARAEAGATERARTVGSGDQAAQSRADAIGRREKCRHSA